MRIFTLRSRPATELGLPRGMFADRAEVDGSQARFRSRFDRWDGISSGTDKRAALNLVRSLESQTTKDERGIGRIEIDLTPISEVPGPALDHQCSLRSRCTHRRGIEVHHKSHFGIIFTQPAIGLRRSRRVWPDRTRLDGLCGGQAASGSRYGRALLHRLTDLGDHRVWLAGACARNREGYSAAVGHDR